MKTSKISLAVLLAMTLSLGLAASSWARPAAAHRRRQGVRHDGSHEPQPGTSRQAFDLKEKMRNDTVDQRKQMMVKHAELAALWKSPTPDEKAIVAKQKELNALRGQMQEKRVTFQLEARKIAPELAQGFGRGMGRGMGGGMGGCPMVGPGGGSGPGAPPK